MAVFALPNAPHAQRCEACRPDVEAALAAHFGRPVPLRLAVDEELAPPEPGVAGAGTPSGRRSGGPPAEPARSESEPDEDVDLTQLTDATRCRHHLGRPCPGELFPGAPGLRMGDGAGPPPNRAPDPLEPPMTDLPA